MWMTNKSITQAFRPVFFISSSLLSSHQYRSYFLRYKAVRKRTFPLALMWCEFWICEVNYRLFAVRLFRVVLENRKDFFLSLSNCYCQSRNYPKFSVSRQIITAIVRKYFPHDVTFQCVMYGIKSRGSHHPPFFSVNLLVYSPPVVCPFRCATNRKVAVSILVGVIAIFHWHNPSDRAMALGSTHPLTGWVPGIFPGGKSGRCVRLTSLPPSWAIVT